jgi:hypothetical protein
MEKQAQLAFKLISEKNWYNFDIRLPVTKEGLHAAATEVLPPTRHGYKLILSAFDIDEKEDDWVHYTAMKESPIVAVPRRVAAPSGGSAFGGLARLGRSSLGAVHAVRLPPSHSSDSITSEDYETFLRVQAALSKQHRR